MNTAIIQKQNSLYEELQTLQDTKTEAMDLCRQYEMAYKEEREQRMADREQMKKTRIQELAKCEQAVQEVNSLRRQLSSERHTTTHLGAENKSLKAQVAFLEQKLKDMEAKLKELGGGGRGLFPSPPKLSDRSQKSALQLRPLSPLLSVSSYADSQTSQQDEFHSKLHHEFDTTEEMHILIDPISCIGVADDSHPPLQDSLTTSSVQQHTAVKPDVLLQTSAHSGGPSLRASVVGRERETEKGASSGWLSDRVRISELKSRNRRMPPHLKSSYAVELQEQPESPSISNDSIQFGKRVRPRRCEQPSALAASSRSTAAAAAIEDSEEEESRKRSAHARSAAGDLSSSNSPVLVRRKVANPSSQTFFTATDDTKWQNPRRATMASGYNLRDFLNNRAPPQPHQDENKANRSGATFELSFSPPRRKTAALPDRLVQRLNKLERPQTKKDREEEPAAMSTKKGVVSTNLKKRLPSGRGKSRKPAPLTSQN